ncbi:MAG: hypothetical protein HFF09_07925 [Oscillospiraceae bacterium]|nr:hypothetical protein [Oscillospiraceae bacterium]
MKGVPEQFLCEYLKKYHCGQESAASSKKLEAALHVKGTELRRAVNRLRCDGHPICSDRTGYFYAARKSEVKATIAQLAGRISKIAEAKNGMLKSYQKKEE